MFRHLWQCIAMGFERRIQIPEYANLQKFASNCEQLRLLTFFWEKSQKTWWLPIHIKDPILSNQLLRQDQKDVVDISCDRVGPAKKGEATQKDGIQILSSFFLSKKRWRVKKSDQQPSLNGLWFGLLCLQPSVLNGALIFGEYFQYNILKALIQLQLVLWGLDDWTFETC